MVQNCWMLNLLSKTLSRLVFSLWGTLILFFSKTGVCATGWCRRSRCRWEYQNNEKKSPPSICLLLNTVGFRFFSSVHSCKMIHVPFSVPENILGEVCKDKGWFFFSCIPLSFAVCAVMRSYLCTAAVFSHPVCCENRDYTRILSGIKWTTDITSLSCGQTSLAVLAYLPATWSVAY